METKKERNARYQREYRERQAQLDFWPVHGFVRKGQLPNVLEALQVLADNPELEVAMFRDTRTGKLRGLSR